MATLDYENLFEHQLGLKRLNKVWAKCEIFGGLACVWLSIWAHDLMPVSLQGDIWYPITFGLFVLGGYLAMAGSRSHLYQSQNRTAAFLWDAIRSQRP